MTNINYDKPKVVKPENKGQGWQTAMSRRSLSVPMKEVLSMYHGQNFEGLRKLDYGCGRGQDADALGFEKYDPNWGPTEIPEGKFDLITCNYVLNVVPPEHWEGIIADIKSRLNPGAFGMIFVRADIKEATKTQWPVHLDQEPHRENSNFRLYVIKGE